MNLIKKTILFILISTNINAVTNLTFSAGKPLEHEKIKCLTLILSKDENTRKLSKTLKYNLEFTDQIEVDLKSSKNKLTPEQEQKMFKKGVSLCLYINSNKKNKVNIELKDIGSDFELFNKNFKIDSNKLVQSTHKISDELLPMLTGEESISKYGIAFCKMISNTKKEIIVSDYACNFEKSIVKDDSINIAPSWHTKAQTLYYSQFTSQNVNLKSINLQSKKSNIICSYEGLNMQPSFSPDGSKAAICMSGGKNPEIYLYDNKLSNKLKRKVFKKLTNNGGNNVSPCLLKNGDVIFCSDFQTGSPQIYYLNRKKDYVYRLTNGKGYCAAPSYNAKTNNVIYSRLSNGIFQLFSLNIDDFDLLQEKQLTFNFGNKHEPDLSPCGRFVVFSYDFEYKKGYQTQQVAVLNVNSKKIRVLTQSKAPKSFPRWSKIPIIA
jgi:tol-pal system beta propeller repeat protein TolB